MKKLGTLVFILSLFYSCKNERINSLGTEKDSDLADTTLTAQIIENAGLWYGSFEVDSIDYNKEANYATNNWISIVIQKITKDNQVEGFSVSAGNKRPFKGKLIKTDSTDYIVVSEPGDHKYDGTFKFNIAKNYDSIYGIWISKRKDLPVYSRKFNLKKTEFNYNPELILKPQIFEYNDGIEEKYAVVDWFSDKTIKEEYGGKEYVVNVNRVASDAIFKVNASTKKLTEKELKKLRKLDLEIIRNTIYARHGYSFSNKGVRQYFDFVDWYVPLFTSVEDKITPLERENIALLKRLEKYAEDNYDKFGR